MPTTTFSPGHTLVGRYRIFELLGVGLTAEVYAAEDLSLGRTVVVKVLLPYLASYEEVRRAFRDRIVRAATLSHPHLARIYDGGQESGAIFLICEYLSGGTLEDVLSSGRTLSVDDGARLGRDVAGALAYAHANGFVHGSLSPSKLLFDAEGRVRVSDLALAGLATGYRERFTINDVRYLSPEQAIGDPPGAESDVYALALIVFEAVTGTSAFDGATTEAVLRARINASLPVRTDLGTLDMILAQATVSDLRLRIDAEQFATRLSAVASNAAPLVVLPLGEVPLLEQFNPSEPRASIGFRPPSPDEIVAATGAAVVGAKTLRPQPVYAPDGTTRSAPPRRAAPRSVDLEDYDRPNGKRNMVLLGVAIALVVVAIAGAVVWRLNVFGSSTTIPTLTGKTFREATNLLATQYKSDGFTLSEDHTVYSSTVPKDVIMSQSPSANTSAKSGQVISVTVSNGPEMVAIPAGVLGSDCAAATLALSRVHVTGQCPSSASIPSATVPAGRVARIIYGTQINPTSVPVGSTVTLALSTGPSTTTTTSPGGTTTTTTTTTPTTAADMVTMPNVVGMNQAQVNAAMHAALLYYTTRGTGAGTNQWTSVVSSVPPAGTKVKKLSTVTLNVK